MSQADDIQTLGYAADHGDTDHENMGIPRHGRQWIEFQPAEAFFDELATESTSSIEEPDFFGDVITALAEQPLEAEI